MRGSKEKDITQKALEMYNDVFADIINVTLANIHNIALLLRVRSNWGMKSKHPLIFKISTIDIVANKNKTTSDAFPTYFRKIFWAINCFTV